MHSISICDLAIWGLGNETRITYESRLSFEAKTIDVANNNSNVVVVYASGGVAIGGYFNPSTVLHASKSDASTGAVTNVATLDHTLTSGAGASGIGVGLLMRAYSSTQIRETGRIRSVLTTATDASRVANLILSVWNVGVETDVLTLTPNGVGVGSSQAYYFGAESTDSTWRIIRSGNDLKFQRRESGSYVDKSTIAA